MAEILLDRVAPEGARRRRDPLPVARTVLYTLDISARFLANAAAGHGTIEVADRLLDGWWRRILRSGNARLVAEGREHFDGRPSVVMSNHTSLLDVPALLGTVPGSLRMVMKQELTRLPIWGKAMVGSGFVPVARGTKEKAIQQLARAEELLGRGVHVWIAPEGTRSRDGELLPFKKGGFHLARSLRAPIVPAWIEGAADILPPDRWSATYDGTITVRFGAPIEAAGADVDALCAEVRRAMLALRGEGVAR